MKNRGERRKMVRALDEEKEVFKSRLGHFKGTPEGRRQTTSLVIENDTALSVVEDEKVTSRSIAYPLYDHENMDFSKIGSALDRMENIKSRLSEPHARERQHQSDMELMKERFSKLLLGEDMSGGGKGVASALALSNSITNLAASVFGEFKRLEPMAPETKSRWRKEVDWLLSVTDHIVEFVPSKQKSKDGTSMEIMVTKQRTDLQMNIPALRKLDAMLLDCLDNFKDQSEFYYVKKGDDESQNGTARSEEKWWIPTPKVPPNGLSEVTRKWLQYQKDSVNQVLKAAMAINAQVLSETEVPESYVESLPKNGRASLGDSVYKSITDEHFDPDYLLSSMDLSSEHKILDLKNRLEASVVIWKRKMNAKDNKSSWGSAVSLEKREIFEDRAETILLILKHRFPGIPQSDLDISKIQCNRDVGQAILESYSRIIESLAFNVLSRIEDVMHADSIARDPSTGEETRFPSEAPPSSMGSEKLLNDREDTSAETPNSRTTLLEFMGWDLDSAGTKKDTQDRSDTRFFLKVPNIITNKKLTYIERLENFGSTRSPTARH